MIRALILACLIALVAGIAYAVTPPYPAATTPLTGAETLVCWQGGVTKDCLTGSIPGTGPVAANNAALQLLPHTYASTVTRLGFAVIGDAPPLAFVASASACSLNAGAGDGGSQVPTSDGGCWIANFSGNADVREWGAKADWNGTTGTDNAPFFQAAGNANVGPITVPDGAFRINTAVTWNANTLPYFVGKGYGEYNGNAACPSTNPIGSWIIDTDTATNPFTYTSTAGSVGEEGFKDIAFCQPHPAPGGGWAPTVYAAIIRINGTGGEFSLNHDYFYAIYDAIDARGIAGVNGRLMLQYIKGQIFHRFLTADNLLDRSSLINFHNWSYWSSNSNVVSWEQANREDLDLQRTDGFQIVNFFSLGSNTCIHLDSSANGISTSVQVPDMYCDLAKYGVRVTGNNSTAYIGSVIADGIGPAGTGSITASECLRDESSGSLIEVDAAHCSTVGKSAIDLNSGGTSSIWTVKHLWVDNYNQDNSSYPAINVATGYRLQMALWPATFEGTNNGGAAMTCASGAICDVPVRQSWTPALAGTVTTGSVSYSTNVGWFIRHGTEIDAGAYITLSAFSGYSGNLFLTGLPFASENTSSLNGQCTMVGSTGWTGAAGYNELQAIVPPNTSQINLQETNSSKTIAAVASTEFTTTTHIEFTCHYFAAN